MAITFQLNAQAVNDQSTGLQTGDNIDDLFTDTDVAYASLPPAFQTYLETTLSLSNAFPTSVGVATKTNSVTVDATGGSAITGIKFTDGSGGALDGDFSGLFTADGKQIFLYAAGDSTVIGRFDSDDADSDNDAIAFVIFKADNLNGTATQAQVSFHIVTYVPIYHPDGTDADDAVDLGNNLKLSASEFIQLDFADLPSGQNLHGTIAIDKTDLSKGGLLLIPKGAILDANGVFTTGNNSSATTNTSKGGGAVTIGNTNQMFDQGEGHYFLYVANPVAASVAGVGLDQNNADDADTIGFNGTLPQTGAQVEIVQVQGNGTASIKIVAYDFAFNGAVDSNAEARDLVTDPLGLNATLEAPTSAVEVDITGVKVYNATGGLVLDSNVALSGGGVTINFTGNSVEITGLNDNYTVEWTTTVPHDGVLIEGLAGKYDLGGFNLLSASSSSTFVGQQIVIEDDGPTASITDTGVVVVHDENNGPQNSGTPVSGEDNNDNDQNEALPAALSGVLNQGAGVTGWAKSPSAVVSTTGTSFGTDGAAATDSAVWSLDIPSPNIDSGFTDLNGNSILLNEETVGTQEVIVGRVSGGPNDGKAALAITIDQSGFLSVAQYLPFFHGDPTNPDDVEVMNDGALLAVLTVTDKDGDVHVDSEAIGDKVRIEDAGPTAVGPDLGFVEEEHSAAGGELAGGNEDTVDGPIDQGADDDSLVDFSITTNVQVTNLANILIVQPGIDAPASFSLDGTKTDLLPALSSKGEALSYDVTGDTLTAFVNGPTAGYQAAEDREVFTWQVTAVGIATFTLLDQLDNTAPLAGAVEDILSVDLTDILVVKDKDNDVVSLGEDFAEYNVIDDVPIFKANIANGQVDFTTITGANLNDFGGTSLSSVTSSLNGSVGTDENDDQSESSDGTKTYTFASADIADSSIAGLKVDFNEDATTAWFFTDGAGGIADQYDLGTDTLWFSNVLDQTANGGDGSYTFTVHKAPVPALVALDFADLPSGQNLHGTIAIDKTDLSKGGLLLIPKGAILDANGVFTTGNNSSATTNTSKGGGAVTIGNTNQMFDQGEGHYFLYVANPVAASVAGVGLDQNNADDADTIGFNGTLPQTGAQVEIVQVQGNGTASIKIVAYDFAFNGAVDSNAEARDLVTDPLGLNATLEAPTSAVEVDITGVKVYNATGGLVLDSNAALSGGGVTINLTGNSAVITGLNDNYSVEWSTGANQHDGVLIEGVAGKYDLGGFNLFLEQPTPDQQFDFTVALNDFDGDEVISNEFSVGVDGTGVNDDDAVTLV